ncbi:hypothetical protein J6590_046857 [Homalodisca vitripennis]|nr:hypothetical protein J6590_046857 [Homalodisca vitripennis]
MSINLHDMFIVINTLVRIYAGTSFKLYYARVYSQASRSCRDISRIRSVIFKVNRVRSGGASRVRSRQVVSGQSNN